MTQITDYFVDSFERRQAWKRVQELAQQWRETRDEQYKAEATPLLAKLMASEALVKIKAMRVDSKLPPHVPKRDYKEFAGEVTASVLSHENSRATALLDKHDPDRGLMSTLVNFYLEKKILTKLQKKKDPAEGWVSAEENVEKEVEKEVTAARHSGYHNSSLLWDDAPGGMVQERDSEATQEDQSDEDYDLKKILSPLQLEILDYYKGGYTAQEAATEMDISESTYKRGLKEIRMKLEIYYKS
jgi:DNA-binding NarL/FixJ family response regulator